MCIDMTERIYGFGNTRIKVVSPVPFSEGGNYSLFRISDSSNNHDCNCNYDCDCGCSTVITVEFADKLPEYGASDMRDIRWTENGYRRCIRTYCRSREQQYYRYVYAKEHEHGIHLVFRSEFKDRLEARLIFEAADIFHLLGLAGSIVIHSSYIVYEGQAVLFCGVSGAGKSTQAALWETYRNAEVINGDRALITAGDEITAGGIFFNGTSGICRNVSAPLKAIVMPVRGSDNTIRRMSGLEAFKHLIKEVSYDISDTGDIERAREILMTVISRIPVYQLVCTPDERAVELLERYL